MRRNQFWGIDETQGEILQRAPEQQKDGELRSREVWNEKLEH